MSKISIKKKHSKIARKYTFNYEFISDIFNNTYKYSLLYHTVCRVWIGPKLLTFLTDPRDVELILSSHVHIDKASEYSFFKPWLGDGLLISTGKLKKRIGILL